MPNLSAQKEFQVSSDLSEVQETSKIVLNFLKPLRLNEGQLFDIRLCLEEALINAIKYGNKLKKHLPVHISVAYDARGVRIKIKDQGQGFDVSKLGDCTKKGNLLKSCGRGVFLIHQLMDKVEYNPKGNMVCMTKILKKEAVHER